MALAGSSPQAAIVDSGSTNRPGMRITLEANSTQAMVEHKDGTKQSVQVPKEMCDKLMKDLQAAGPLDELPVRHCPKSVSFGSSLYVEFAGKRSGDVSCRGQTDQRAAALQKDAEDILQIARGN